MIKDVIFHDSEMDRDRRSTKIIDHVCANGHHSMIIDVDIPGTATIVACVACPGTRMVNRPDYDGPEP